jgi:membrane protease YdiL (CAAX protease family)
MKKCIYESIIQLAVVLPLILLFVKKYNKENGRRILVFSLLFIAYQLIENLPKHVDFLKIIKGSWNWNGKILGIVFGIGSYFLFRRLFAEHDYFKLKQDKAGFKKAVMVSLAVVILATVLWSVFGKETFNLESLAFQLTLPGIDEEIMYRGIFLGLLMSGLKERVKGIGNPGLLITSILFGLIHALKLNDQYSPTLNLLYFVQTGLAGYAWGWVTIKSKSIVLAMLSHNFSNFFGTLAMMLK